VVLSLASGLLTQACREQTTQEIDRNQPPETVLTGAPGDSTTTFYFTHLYWYGVDPDGKVIAFEFAVTDSIPEAMDEIEWHRTTRRDSLFALPVGETQEIMGRRFYIRAIDNNNRVDETPAWTFFTVRDNAAPTIEFTRSVGIGPNGEEVPITSISDVTPTDTIPTGWDVEFKWRGLDRDVALYEDGVRDTVGHVVGYSYHLAPIESSYLGGTLRNTSASYRNLISGSYIMFVRGMDDAGFAALNPTIRSFVWNRDPQTWFTRGDPDSSGPADSLAHFFDVEGNEYFNGDTLNRASGAGHTITAWVRGSDPDDPEGLGRVRDFEFRKRQDGGGLPWAPIQTLDNSVVWARLLTGDYDLLARCSDILGRVDGSPAKLTFYVNKSPRFRASLQVGPTLIEQTPQEGQVFPVDEVADGLPCRFLAYDPDRQNSDLRPRFFYKFTGPRDYHETFWRPMVQAQALSASVYFVQDVLVPERYDGRLMVKSEPYEITIQVIETFQDGSSENPRKTELIIHFYITSG
ncbi:MAG: hypothetical protein KJ927_04910, partial [Candidatus Eisenbacteria bacterium]|nr:hypothetical protein [Candidatus Eisenbacteria bacterium]